MSLFGKLAGDFAKAKAIFDRAAAKRGAATEEFNKAVSEVKSVIAKAEAEFARAKSAAKNVAGK